MVGGGFGTCASTAGSHTSAARIAAAAQVSDCIMPNTMISHSDGSTPRIRDKEVLRSTPLNSAALVTRDKNAKRPLGTAVNI